jgi:hypothetical protein
MADISAFPAINTVNHNNGPTWTFTATTAVKRGMACCHHATGVSNAVIPAVAGAGTEPFCVAQDDIAAGSKGAFCLVGTIATVANADDTTGIDAGDWVGANDNAVGGTVSALDFSASGATSTNLWALGKAIEDIAGGATGKIIIMPCEVTKCNSS